MPQGFHLSFGGNYDKALQHAQNSNAQTVQIFTHSPRSFAFPDVDQKKYDKLLAGWKQHKIGPIFSHCNYLINLGSSNNKLFYGSLNTVKKELEFCNHFGCEYFVLHVGKYKDSDMKTGMQQIAKAVEKLKDTIHKTNVMILFETVAGAGTEIGAKFEELNELLEMLDPDVREHIGVCVDTCHIFAAGYDIRTKEGVENVVKNIESTFGVKRIKLIHVNDSKGELGDHLDRHERLGKGKIGLAGLKAFLTHPKIRNIPMVLETPWETLDEQKEDLEVLQSFFK